MQDALNAKKQLSSKPVLFPRKKEVLQNMAAELTSQQIADKLFVSRHTIDSYRISLMIKSGVKSAPALFKKRYPARID